MSNESDLPIIDFHGNKIWRKPDQLILHRLDGPAIIFFYGLEEWWYEGRRHRVGGPARYTLYTFNYEEYWEDGLLHRIDGPAIISNINNESWYIKGKRHRLDGPAIINSDGDNEWWFNDKQINCHSQEEFERLIKLKAFW